jgi:hypothetical protein
MVDARRLDWAHRGVRSVRCVVRGQLSFVGASLPPVRTGIAPVVVATSSARLGAAQLLQTSLLTER